MKKEKKEPVKIINRDNNYKYSNIQYKSNKKLEDSPYNNNTKKKLNLKTSCENYYTKVSESNSNLAKEICNSNQYSQSSKLNKNSYKDNDFDDIYGRPDDGFAFKTKDKIKRTPPKKYK